MTSTIQVGQRLDARIPSYPEGSIYAWDSRHGGSHHRLVAFAASPTASERIAFASGGALEFALLVDQPSIVLLWRGDGWPWSDAPYSWHLQAAGHPEVPIGAPDTTPVPAGKGVPLDAILVDASSGVVVCLRRVAMPGDFASAIHRAIEAQVDAPWDPRAYDAAVKAIAAEDCDVLVRRASARCRVGAR